MDVRKFKRPETKGTSSKGIDTPHTNPEVTDDQKQTSSGDYKVPEETNQDMIQEYLGYLKKEDIHKEDIFSVLDSIITTGNVFWNFKLFDKIPVTFKIRPAWVNDILIKKMDKEPPKTFNRFSDIVGLYNLSGSLVEYNGQKFKMETEDDFYKTKKFIQDLPFIVQSHLIRKMAIFDRVVTVATSDWAAQNFTEPQSEK